MNEKIALVNGQKFIVMHEAVQEDKSILYTVKRPKGKMVYPAKRCNPSEDCIYGADRYYIL